MDRVSLPIHGPEKPRLGEPCNGCGFCCAAEVCAIGLVVYGEQTPAPCPAMRFKEGRFWCAVVQQFEPIGVLLGIGMGCDSNDPEPAKVGA